MNIVENFNRLVTDGTSFDDPSKFSGAFVCPDGFVVSVQAKRGSYSTRRVVFGEAPVGPFTTVEVGFPSVRPEPWEGVWETFAQNADDPTDTVYAFVPIELVRDLLASHGAPFTQEVGS